MIDKPGVNSTRSLFEAAKADRPDAAARAKMWNGVEVAARVAVSTSATALTTKATTAVQTKGAFALLAGAKGAIVVAGGVVALGATLIASGVGSSRTSGAHGDHVSSIPRTSRVPEAPRPTIATELAAAPYEELPDDPANARPARSSVLASSTVNRAPADGDSLLREASLVSDARVSLRRGDATSALEAVRKTKALATRELEPEELALEAQALRAMHRDAEATTTEMQLRLRYPNHALVRALAEDRARSSE